MVARCPGALVRRNPERRIVRFVLNVPRRHPTPPARSLRTNRSRLPCPAVNVAVHPPLAVPESGPWHAPAKSVAAIATTATGSVRLDARSTLRASRLPEARDGVPAAGLSEQQEGEKRERYSQPQRGGRSERSGVPRLRPDADDDVRAVLGEREPCAVL